MGCVSKTFAMLAFVVLGIGACASDDETKPGTQDALPDQNVTDGGVVPVPEGTKLYECTEPGKPCSAHDPCAINPVCGDDLLCRPTGYQDCADDLACTDDICEGQGKCAHVPKDGTCSLLVKDPGGGPSVLKCFAAEERNPEDQCKECRPDESKYKWSAANGGVCDDGDNCTKGDYCSDGVCKGTFYGEQCQDEYSCTEDVCDGNGGCVGNPLKADACLINGECYSANDKDTDGCNVCDPTQSQNAWTPLKEHCLIGGTCYMPGEEDSTKCSVCDPTKSKTAWTPLPGLCKIGSECFQKGDTNTSEGGCGECDPAVNPSGWTVKGDFCYIGKECQNPGATDDTGCGECVPAKDKYDWSAVANTCFIEGLCYTPAEKDPTQCGECDPVIDAKGWTVKIDKCLVLGTCYDPQQKDDTGCGVCDPAKDRYAFTALTNKCLIGKNCHEDQAKDDTGCLQCLFATAPGAWNPSGATKLTNYDFESAGTTGWTIANSDATVGWQVSVRRPAGGKSSLYYGDPAAGNYDSGAKNNGTATTPEITLSATGKTGIRFWLYMDTEKGANYDKLEVQVVDGTTATTVWQKNATTDSTITMQTWTEVKIDLAAYKGKAIKIQFAFDTTDSVSNSSEGTFIDDLAIYHGCP